MGKIVIGVVVVVAVVAFFVMRDSGTPTESTQMVDTAAKKMAPAKEFTMTSYYDDKGAWFSLKEMTVKKGDLVRVKVTNTKGTHDFTLDEFGIKKDTPLDTETVIEFTADKAGTFEYYCSMPGHRARGQFGKLIVTE